MKRKGICGSQLSHIPHIPSISVFPTYPALCEMCPNTEFFWSVFSCIRTEYGEIRNIFPYPLRMRQNTDQKKLRIWTLFTHAVYYTLFDGSKKSELGYNLTTSSNKATRI